MSAIQWRPGKPRKKKEEAAPRVAVCPFCQQEFTPTGSRTYCSDKCRAAAQRQRDQNRMENLRRVRQVGRTCHDCGKPTTDYRCPACWRKRRHVEPDTHRTDGGYIFA